MNDSTELDRIRRAYETRDADHALQDVWNPMQPGLLCVLQQRERALVRLLRRVGWLSLRSARVLELGCGDGNILAVFQRLGASPENLYGIDLMSDRVADAASAHPAFEIIQGDASNTPFESGSFDIVCQFTMFSSVNDEVMRAKMTSEMKRLVRPGGVVISYDLRPISFGLRVVRSLRYRVLGLGGGQKDDSHENVVVEGAAEPSEDPYNYWPLEFEELRNLFSGYVAHREPANLDPELARYAGRFSAVRSDLLAGIPWLRSHELVAFSQR